MSYAKAIPTTDICEEFCDARASAKISPRAQRKRGPFGGALTTFLVLAAPALWIGWMIFKFGVDTPWGDQWDSTRLLFDKATAGTLGVSDFLAFHNEHRIVFPRLIAFALGTATHWNIRAELFVIWILACFCALNIWRLVQVTGWRDSRHRDWLLLGAITLLFAPTQWENLLWGFQIGFFLPLATMTACPWAAGSFRRPYNFIATIALCLVSTFSIASGFASWFFTAPLLYLAQEKTTRRTDKVWWCVWSTVAIASVGLYFYGFKHPSAHPSPMLAAQRPVAAFQFLLAYLGNPFCSGTALPRAAVAQFAGGALLLPLLGSVIYLWRFRRDQQLLADVLPWLGLASIALVNAALTTVGRFGFGMNLALQSRYVSFALLLPIALLFTVSWLFRHWRERRPASENITRAIVLCASFVTALAMLFGCAAIHSLDAWRFFQHERLAGRTSLLFLNFVDEPKGLVRYVHWSHRNVKNWSETVDRIGYLHPRLLRSANIRPFVSELDADSMGCLDKAAWEAPGELTLSGWAVLLAGGRTADRVLLTCDDANGDPIVFALAEVSGARQDISDRLRDQSYQRSGWTKNLRREELPPGAKEIKAWAFDAEQCRAFLIGGVWL